MNLGGSGGGTVFFVLTLLSALASFVECYSYYELIPKIEFVVDRQVYRTIQGDYVSYGPNTDFSKLLNVINDPFFGCTAEANDTGVPSYPSQSAFLIPESSHCTITEKSSFLSNTYKARAVLLYRLSDSNDEDRERRQTAQRTSGQTSSRSGPTVIRLNLLTEQLTHLLTRQSANSMIQINVEAQLVQRGFKTTQTFYFVVFAFCILMLLSCSWLLLSYFKRCHYRWRLRRNQARSANETRQMMNRLPTKSYKISKEKGEVPTCVVCLEVFKNHDSIRILPCKHEFHKKCIDPWLKMKRTCPMCKQDIFPSKRRKSSSDATSQRNTTRASSQDPTAVLVTTAASSRSLRRTRSWSDSSNTSGSSNSSVASSNTSSNTSATPLLSANDSRSYGDSEVQVIVVNSVIDSSMQGTEEDNSTAIEMDVSSGQQDQEPERPREEREGGETSGQNGHISVDVEGLGHLHPAPVVNA